MNDQYSELKNIIKSSKRAVFFGGAGVSTESGIPDFRSVDGLYMMNYKYPPEEILSRSFFNSHTEEFYKFYRKYLCFPDAKPNISHFKLAEMEQKGILSAVVTQNVDGLHTKAGSRRVFELHGSALRNYCTKCKKFYDFDSVYKSEGIPRCECGGIIKPDVVLYEEPLDEEVISGAVNAIAQADTLIVAGTSLTVYPAAGFVRYFSGKNLIIVNKDVTEMDSQFNCVIHAALGEVMCELSL